MLLYLDDRTLNKYIPLKALAPYRDGYVVPGYKKKRLLSEFQREVEKIKKDFVKEIKNKKDIEETNKNLLQKKHNNVSNNPEKSSKKKNEKSDNKDYDPNNKQDFRKKKRLETYGIIG